MMKYANYLILAILLCVAFLSKDHINISTNLLSLFASKESIQKLHIASELGYSKEMLIAIKGFDNSAKSKLYKLSKELTQIEGIKNVQTTLTPSDEQMAYYADNYALLASFNNKIYNNKSVKEELQKSYDAMLENIFYTPIDKNDPLQLFSLQRAKSSNLSHRGEFLTLGDFGYLIRVTTDVSASQMSEAKVLYSEVQAILKSYPDSIAFAPFFYTVENSTKIKDDVERIVILSSFVLILIYYLLIKNIKLLSHTLLALASSMLFATLVTTLSFSNFSVLSLAFGMSITAVSIDYLLHYYFHNFYQGKKKIDRNVLYGFLTTTLAFGVFSFIPIPIISQISFFAVLSLSFAYILFTFVFPKLDIKEYREDITPRSSSKKISASIFFLLSILLLGFSAYNTKLDNNIRNLDYQNISLMQKEEFFKSALKSPLRPVIVQAKTQSELIDNLHRLHLNMPNSFSLATFVQSIQSCKLKQELLNSYDFKTLTTVINDEATKIGFKDGYFKNAYSFVPKKAECKIEDLKIFEAYSLYLYKDSESYYTIALVDDVTKASTLNFVTDIDVKNMFKKQASQMYDELAIYSLIVIILIFTLLKISVKNKFLYALNFIIFPSSVVLAILSVFYSINLMHLFSLIILVAIGIDYGIYMSNSNKQANTILAIRYSLLSTFAGFGVLLFSSIVALESIGIVISLGIVSIFFLIKVQK